MSLNLKLPDDEVPRRTFLKIAIGLLNALVAFVLAIPGLGYLLTPVFRKDAERWVPIGPVAKFKPGQPRKAIFSYTTESGYTIREKKRFVWVNTGPTADDMAVYSAVCTHMGCNVAWHSNVNLFLCPCHGGMYDIDGEVVAGPPPAPLQKLAVKLENGQILVRLPT
ncbi:MAG: ubiquinol-cytochrome c reductase iron-sulfur subunit [bacterium]